MKISILNVIAVVSPLLLLEGLFSGSEIALLAADKIKLKGMARRGSHRAKRALELTQHPEKILSATLLMTSICVTGISAIIALYVISNQYTHPDLVSIAITSPLIVILGELVPKTIYQRYA